MRITDLILDALLVVLCPLSLLCLLTAPASAASPQEGALTPFMGPPAFEVQRVFSKERHPNVAVATDGTVLVTLGNSRLLVRRSTRAGERQMAARTAPRRW